MWAESGVTILHSHSWGVREAVKVLTSRREERGVWPWGCGCGPELRWCWGVVGSEVTGFLGQWVPGLVAPGMGQALLGWLGNGVPSR